MAKGTAESSLMSVVSGYLNSSTFSKKVDTPAKCINFGLRIRLIRCLLRRTPCELKLLLGTFDEYVAILRNGRQLGRGDIKFQLRDHRRDVRVSALVELRF